jgi:histidinol-phosphatase (PHP family)
MIDAHIHIEKGPYTLEWINEFVKTALDRHIDEISLLEHCYLFNEFTAMYDRVCAYSDYIDRWFHRRAGRYSISNYLDLIEKVRRNTWPVKIKFGLEVCYFKDAEEYIYNNIKDLGLDFVTGSVHFIDCFAYDHIPDLWNGVDVDNIYRRYFETSVDLAKSGIFSGIGHPDSIKLFGHKASFALTDQYEELAEALKRNDMYAEESGGLHTRGLYAAELGMNTEMLKIMKQKNVTIYTASDAHSPFDVGLNIEKLQRLIDEK